MSTSPPTEYFPGINFNVAFYNAGGDFVTKDYVDSNFLKSVGYAISRAISTTFNNIVYFNGGFEVIGDLTATGTIYANDANITNTILCTNVSAYSISANNFTGSGAGLTNIDGSVIKTGIVEVNVGGTGKNTLTTTQILVGNNTDPIIQSSNLTWDNSNNIFTASNVAGNGSRLSNLNASNVSDGTLAVTRGGTGASNFTAGRLLIGNDTSAITNNGNLTWTAATNTLTITGTATANTLSGTSIGTNSLSVTGTATIETMNATNISGNGSTITNINVSNADAGTLSASRGGTGVNGFGQYRILFGSGGNGPIATLPDLTFDGNTFTCYGEFNTFKGLKWDSQFSRLNRVLTANQFSTGSAIGDIVLISNAKLHLIGGSTGSTAPGLTIDASNNIGIGTTVPAATDKLTVSGNTKITGTATIDTNLVVGGSAGIIGTTQFTGNVGIGKTASTTYKLDVNGSLNATTFFLNGSAFTGNSQWNTGIDTTEIFYNVGNVGIGTSNPINLLELTKSSYTGALLSLDAGVAGAGAGVMANAIGKPLLRLGRGFYSSAVGDYYGIGFGYAPLALSNSCCEIGVKVSSTTGNQIGDILFSTRAGTTDIPATERMRITSAGNVGIGHSAPIAPLCVGNSSLAGSDGFILIGKNNGGGGSRHQRIGYNANFELVIGDAGSGTLGGWTEAFKLSYAAPANSLVIGGNGNVGIGVAPSYKLHHKCSYNDVGTGIHLDADDGGNNPNKYTLTIWPFVVGGGQVGWRFRTQSLDGGNNTPLEFNHNGTLKVMADRWHESNDGKARLYFATNGTTYFRSGNALGEQFGWRSALDNTFAYFNNNVLYAYMYNLSDRRIKRDIEEINDETALNMLLLVQPTTYYYRDETRNKGNGKVYGFIAQQIKEVIPEAVNITKDIIANIYKTCLVYNKREIYHSIPQNVAIDTEVHILDKEIGEKGKRYKIKEIYEDHFVIDEDIDGDDCFVFGYCVDDLNALDKSYIFTLNVCATQELHRRMEAQEKRIKELEAKIELLINQ